MGMARKQTNRRKYTRVCQGLFTRLLFILHSVVSFYLLYNKNTLQLIHLLLIIPLVFLIIESFITLVFREGRETKYVWPSGFFYIATIVPIIWILELNLLEKRKEERGRLLGARNVTVSVTNTGGIDGILEQVREFSNQVDGRKVAEIGVIICIIIGRWLAPRTSMSRNQLSNLLLGYVANAADIMELFESLQSKEIIFNTDVTIGVLAVYSWSLLQFTIVTTATVAKKPKKKSDVSKNQVLPNKGKGHDRQEQYVDETDRGSNYQNIERSQSRGEHEETTTCCNCCKCHPEYFQIFVTILMQDGPFLMLRLALCIEFRVLTELHIFFLCKNGIMCILLIYRLIILGCGNDDDDDDVNDECMSNNIIVDTMGPPIHTTENKGIDNPVIDVQNPEKDSEPIEDDKPPDTVVHVEEKDDEADIIKEEDKRSSIIDPVTEKEGKD